MPTIAVVNLGTGNLRSVVKALEHVGGAGTTVRIVDDGAGIGAADRVVLPGQGAIGTWMRMLAAAELREAVMKAFRTVPVLGLCLGLEALFDESDEDGGVAGLGVFSGAVRRFEGPGFGAGGLKIPHMGWNNVRQQVGHAMFDGIADGERFYFVHSYFVGCDDASVVAATTDYGIRFTSAAARDNIFAVQFHPEKSQAAGLRMLENFTRWRP